MPKTKISEYSATANSNTDVASINIDEGCAPSGINNAIRAVMGHLKDFQSGTSNDPFTVGSSGSLTLSYGTANGVAYLNGSKVLTTGSALTFNGTSLGVGSTASVSGGTTVTIFGGANASELNMTRTTGSDFNIITGASVAQLGTQTNYPISFIQNGSEQMRLTSTGLGIGTSSPATKLEAVGTVRASSGTGQLNIGITGGIPYIQGYDSATAGNRQLAFYTGSEVMRLDSSGNLGLGVTPSAWGTSWRSLDMFGWGSVASASDNMNVLNNAYITASGSVYKNNGLASRYNQSGGVHSWFNAPTWNPVTNPTGAITFTQAMTLTASGNLLLGTTTDVSTVRMQVWSASSDNIAYFRNTNATPYGPSIKYTAATPNNTGSEFLYCEDSTALRASLRSNGGLANYSANNVNLSDARTKTEIQNAGGYLTKICAIPVRTFKYKDQSDNLLNLGVIAQEVEVIAPELVDISGFGETPEDGVPLKAIYQTDLQYALMKCIQEQNQLIQSLTDRITALEGEKA